MPRDWHPPPSSQAPGPAADYKPLVRPANLAPFHADKTSFDFGKLCQVMTAIRSADGLEKKRAKLEKFLENWRAKIGFDLYPVIRLLIPERDRERSVFQLKEAKLAKAYNAVLGIDPKSNQDANQLEHWKQPIQSRFDSAIQPDTAVGDFPTVLLSILKRKSDGKDRWTIDQVNTKLDELAEVKGDNAQVVRIIAEFNRNLSPDSQSWLVRIILKDMKLTIKEKTILDVFHPDAMPLFIVCSDLKRVCWQLWDTNFRMQSGSDEIKIHVFSPFVPMFSARNNGSYKDAVKAMRGPFMIEEKLDGERIQLHKKGDSFQYWSRQHKDYTYLYGRDRTQGSLTPYIADAFREDIEDCILDGEMLAYDPDLERYLPFGTLKTTSLSSGKEQDGEEDPTAPNVIFMVFDIVYIRRNVDAEGISLASDPRFQLAERKKLLEGGPDRNGKFRAGVISTVRNRLEFPYRRENCTRPEEIKEELESVLKRRGEGLMLKRNTAMYGPSSRSNAWMKIKPDYWDELHENADLLVIGGWYGGGHRGGKIGSFLLGLKTDETDSKGDAIYQTVGRVGSGLNMRDFDWIERYHGKDWRKFNRKDPSSWPTCIKFAANGSEDKPDVWIHPKNSFVIEVKAAAITPSIEFAMGETFRFPRAKFLRYDLASQQTMAANKQHHGLTMEEHAHFSVKDWVELRDQPHKIRVDDETGLAHRKRKMTAPRKKQKVLSAFAGIDSSKIEVKDNIFENTTAYIITGSTAASQKELQTQFKAHGGKIKLSAKATTDGSNLVVVSSKLFATTKTIERTESNDILKPEWIIDSIKAGRQLPLHKQYLLFATEDTKAEDAYEAELQLLEVDASSSEAASEDDRARKVAPSLRKVADRPEGESADEEEDSYSSHTEAEDGDDDDGDLAQFTEDLKLDSQQPEQDVKMEVADQKDSAGGSAATESEGSDAPSPAAASQGAEAEPVTKAHDQPLVLVDDDDSPAEGDLYLRHMVFYLDTLDNWRKNGLEEPDIEEDVSDELTAYGPQIREHGGMVTTSIRDPALTHIVMCSDEYDRYGELLDVSKVGHKYRQIVAVSWLKTTFEQSSPQPESALQLCARWARQERTNDLTT